MTFQEVIQILIDGGIVRRYSWREDVYIKFVQYKDSFYKDPVLGLFSEEQPNKYMEIYMVCLKDISATDWEVWDLT